MNSIKKLFLNENENNFELFKQKKIWNLFKSKYRWKNFIEVFLNKVSSINKFGLLFKLFPLEAFDLNFTEKILEKFDDRNIINSFNNNLCPNLNEDLYSILKIVIKNRYDVKKYTNIIENKLFLNEERINNIYIYILNQNENSIIENIQHLIINFFMEKHSKLTPENFFFLIKSAKSEKFL